MVLLGDCAWCWRKDGASLYRLQAFVVCHRYGLAERGAKSCRLCYQAGPRRVCREFSYGRLTHQRGSLDDGAHGLAFEWLLEPAARG